MNDSEVRELLQKLPPIHVANPPLHSISYVDKVYYTQPGHRRFPPELVWGECNIVSEQRVGVVTLFRQQEQGNNDVYDFEFTIYHEIGHTVFELILGSNQKIEWYSLCGEEIARWNPAGGNPLEHFCDSYAHYMVSNEMEKRSFSSEYEFMKKYVFNIGGIQ